MCVIIYAPHGHISGKQLRNSLVNNPDGWGVCWPSKGKVEVVKGMTSAEFFSHWGQIRKIDAPKIFHSRIGTSGDKDVTNVHPFPVTGHGELVMCHNGVIGKQSFEGPLSDTRNFIENILADLPVGFHKHPVYQELIEEYIGYSKLVFMDGDGGVDIIGEKKGHWANGNWYSNNSYSFSANTKRSSSCYVANNTYYGGKNAGRTAGCSEYDNEGKVTYAGEDRHGNPLYFDDYEQRSPSGREHGEKLTGFMSHAEYRRRQEEEQLKLSKKYKEEEEAAERRIGFQSPVGGGVDKDSQTIGELVAIAESQGISLVPGNVFAASHAKAITKAAKEGSTTEEYPCKLPALI